MLTAFCNDLIRREIRVVEDNEVWTAMRLRGVLRHGKKMLGKLSRIGNRSELWYLERSQRRSSIADMKSPRNVLTAL